MKKEMQFLEWQNKMESINILNSLLEDSKSEQNQKEIIDDSSLKRKKISICIGIVAVLLFLYGLFYLNNVFIFISSITLVIFAFFFFNSRKNNKREKVRTSTDSCINKERFLEFYKSITDEIETFWNNKLKLLSSQLEEKLITEQLSYDMKLELEALISKREFLSFEQGDIVNKFYSLNDDILSYNAFVEDIYNQVNEKIRRTVKAQLVNYEKLEF